MNITVRVLIVNVTALAASLNKKPIKTFDGLTMSVQSHRLAQS
jgi:hypothetical protein